MSTSRPIITKTVSALIAVAVIVSMVTIGGVAQTDSEDGDASDGDAEPNDSIANATRIQYGQEIDANLSSPSDVDYYAINASAGDAIIPRIRPENRLEKGYTISVDLVTPNGEVRTELTNDVASGSQNFACQEGYTGNVMEFDGTYYVRVQVTTHPSAHPFCDTQEPNESATYHYNLTVNRTSVDEYEPNENGTTATSLELGETVNATYVGYDSDVYAVNLTAGQNYTVTLEDGFHGTIWVYGNESQPVDDPFWPHSEDNSSPYNFDPNGSTIATVWSTLSGTSSVSFTPEENKTYYVQIVQNIYNGNLLDQSPYELTVNRTAGTPSDDGTGEPESPDDEDADSDGLTDAKEETLGTDPRNVDTDDDGLTDGQEVTEYGTDPLSEDTDDDGLTDECELRNDTDPTNPDTDGDGTLDGEEV